MTSPARRIVKLPEESLAEILTNQLDFVAVEASQGILDPKAVAALALLMKLYEMGVHKKGANGVSAEVKDKDKATLLALAKGK